MVAADDLEPADVAPITVTIPNNQIPGAPDGTYFSGTFTAAVQDGNTVITNWAVKINFAWSGGGSALMPAPQ